MPERLRNQHAVERIAKGTWQRPGACGVGNADRQFPEALAGDSARNVRRERRLEARELAESMLGGNLPSGGGADQDLVFFLGDRLTRVR